MSTKDKELSLHIALTSNGSNVSLGPSFMMESVTASSAMVKKLRHGDPIAWSQLFSMMSYDCQRSARRTAEETLDEPSTEKPLRNSTVTLSLVQLLAISSHLETLGKRLVSLTQKLTPTDASGRAITSEALRQADSQVALTTLELEAISRILRRDFAEYLSPIQE